MADEAPATTTKKERKKHDPNAPKKPAAPAHIPNEGRVTSMVAAAEGIDVTITHGTAEKGEAFIVNVTDEVAGALKIGKTVRVTLTMSDGNPQV